MSIMKTIHLLMAVIIFYAGPVFSGGMDLESASDYDQVCEYFDQLQDEISTKTLTPKQRGQFISDRVNKHLGELSHARELWEVIRYAVPEERYEMFKVTAEEQTGKAWECESMRRLISSAGE